MADSLKFTPPARFDRTDKARWRRALKARQDSENPLKVGEIDTLADLVDARRRLDDLNELLDGEYASGGSPYLPTVLKLHSQIAATTRTARQLARDLHLLD